MNWWDAEEYEHVRMFYPDPDPLAPRRRVALTTEPEMVRLPTGATHLRLVNRHPHERLRLFVGPRKTCLI